MKDEDKTKEQLISELKALRGLIIELEAGETERKRAEEMFYKAFHMSPFPISLSRLTDGYYIDLNQSFLHLFGYTRDQVIGHTFLELNIWVNPADRKRVIEALQEGKPVRNIEVGARTKSGELRSGSYSAELIEVGDELCLMSVYEDITERKKREAALQESERRYRLLAENVSDVIWTLDMNMQFTYQSPSVARLRGYSAAEAMSQTLDKALTPASYEAAMKAFTEEIEKEKLGQNDPDRSRTLELELTCRDGSTVWAEAKMNFLRDPNGGAVGILGVTRDITSRKLTEAALRESEERFRKLFEESPIAIQLYDSKGDLLQINKSCVDMFGIVDIAEKKEFNIFKDPNLPDDAKRRMSRGETAKYGHIFDFEKVKEHNLYRTTKSGFIYVDVLATPLGLKSDGTLKGYMLEIEDVTWRKRAEEQVHLLMQQLIKTQEAERQRLSRELHDSVAQDLFALKFGLDTAFDSWPDVPPELRRRISTLSEVIKKSLKEIRDLAYDLRPPGLDHLGLGQSIFQYCEEFSARTGIDVDFAAAGIDGIRLDFDTEITIFRLIQEGLNNVKKHAEAKNVTIRLVASFPKIILRIEDDGKGFDVRARLISAFKEKRMGLQSMKERVNLLQGKMRIKSRRMRGTKVLIQIPYVGRHDE